ncbi:MAG: helix-turn-helix domain-containing protein [Candidatus Woesearchaeota archaeon]|jgi:sugar-specific transcriptional regulator TrmB
MNQNIKEILTDLGFEEREISIYLTLIKNPAQTAMHISQITKIDRTTTYDILERLINKGIVSTILKNNTKTFTALKPKELLNYFKNKYSSLERILPEIQKISNNQEELLKCEIFQGKNGLKTVLKDLIETAKEYKVIGIKKEYAEILGFFNDQGILKVNENKIKEIGIYSKGEQFKKLKNGRYKEIKEKLSPITTLIYNDKVIFFVWLEPYFAIKIDNKTFRKGQEEYFTMLWNMR